MTQIRPRDDKNDTAWSSIPALDDGIDLNNFRKTGVYTVVNPLNAPAVASYFLTAYNANIDGQRRSMQRVRDVSTGEEQSRTYDGLVWSAWTVSSSGSGGGSSGVTPWSRPVDWLQLPADAAEMVTILTAVFNDSLNFATINATITGNYVIDWGDGNIENAISGAIVSHTYDYNNASLNGTLTSLGYKQAIITLTPQVNGNSFSAVDLSKKHPSAGANTMISRWLDVRVNCPNATVFHISSFSATYPELMERCSFTGFGALSNAASIFNKATALQQVDFADGMLNATTNVSNMFFQCVSLRQVTFPPGALAAATAAQSMFQSCYLLETVTFPDGALGNATTLNMMFNSCAVLKSIDFPPNSLLQVTNMTSTFLKCYTLNNVTFADGTLGKVTSLQQTFNACYALKSVVFPAGSLADVTTINGIFYTAYSLESIAFPAGSLSKCLRADNAFRSCSALADIQFPAGALALCTNFNDLCLLCTALYKATFPDGAFDAGTNFSQMFKQCDSLEILEFPAGGISQATNVSELTRQCQSIRSIVNLGSPISINMADGNLDGAALDAIYTSLPTVTGQTITVTGQPGIATHTPSIATSKGWTVVT